MKKKMKILFIYDIHTHKVYLHSIGFLRFYPHNVFNVELICICIPNKQTEKDILKQLYIYIRFIATQFNKINTHTEKNGI